MINYYWRLLMDRLVLSILLSTMILYEYYYYCLLLKIYIYIYHIYMCIDYDYGDWLVLLKIIYIHIFFNLLFGYYHIDYVMIDYWWWSHCWPHVFPGEDLECSRLVAVCPGRALESESMAGHGTALGRQCLCWWLMAEIWVMRRGFHKGAFSKMHGL